MTRHGEAPRTTRRALLVSGACVLASSGCFGSFSLTGMLYDWNGRVSDDKWVRWLVFLGLVILPVYKLLILADMLVLNTIEFWTGDNPAGGARISDLGEGHTLTSIQTADPDLVRHEHRYHGSLVRILYVRRSDDGNVQLLDVHGQVLSKTRQDESGAIMLLDNTNAPTASLCPIRQREIVRAFMADGQVCQHVIARARQVRTNTGLG
jgi:hypothetical protein